MTASIHKDYIIGLISGTSMDGIDAALIELDTKTAAIPIKLVAGQTYAFDQSLGRQLTEAKASTEVDHLGWVNSDACHRLDQALAHAFAEAALRLIDEAKLQVHQIKALGSHGQTLCHRPDDTPPISLQLGDPNTIARLTGITTVGRFRQADLKAGGQGAPLAPLIHEHLFRHPKRARAVLNLGGIANVTVLKPGEPVMGFDTGPANALLDLWYQRHQSGSFDADGAWASQGTVNQALLASAVADAYFHKAPPKSTSIEYFGPQWLAKQLMAYPDLNECDVQATLSELTAQSVAHALAAVGGVDEVIVCGGGAKNKDLLSRLDRALPNTELMISDALGVSADHLEAMLFAWLAHERLMNHALDTRQITGAQQPVLLGEIFLPS